MAPATMPAMPATSRSLLEAWAAATPMTRLAVEMIPSLAPSTAARSQPIRSVRCRSRCGRMAGLVFGPYLASDKASRKWYDEIVIRFVK